MDLPIDHFRLLGVSPAADAQQVLRTLQQRLDRIPYPGFTPDTLQGRADLLRASADLLSDEERRADYEADLTSLTSTEGEVVPALDVSTPLELPGLLLLLEASQPLECFEMACRCLQPPQAPALGSGREADLTLLAGHSCLEAAAELRQQRRYEAAARTLQEGLQLLQRMGQQPDLREAMNRELELLTPYRVLDLLSRDLGAVEERREGLALLEQLVDRRGGLEGNADPHFGFTEFQAFFKQIRGFLTVQEQVDLFSRWGDAGSEAADFLATTALTASGFAQRKPERIAAARDRLLASGRPGVEPLLANLYLLLGQVDTAKTRFAAGAGKDLQAWAARQSQDGLGQVCAYCRDWLMRDVLPGYRDLDADPDLEAYFSDRDVLAYVAEEDRRRGRTFLSGPAAGSPLEGSLSKGFEATFSPPLTGGYRPATLEGGRFAGGGGSGHLLGERPPADHEQDLDDELEDVALGWSLPRWRLPDTQWLLAGVAGLGLLLLAGSWLLRSRQPSPPVAEKTLEKPVLPAARPDDPATARNVPLRSASPTEQQMRGLLESWLEAKSSVLRGGEAPPFLAEIARPNQIERLRSERRRDRARGQSQQIQAEVSTLRFRDRSPRRIEVEAEIAYSDRLLDASGKELERTAPTNLRNVYVFGRDGETWRLAASSPAN